MLSSKFHFVVRGTYLTTSSKEKGEGKPPFFPGFLARLLESTCACCVCTWSVVGI